MAQVHDWMSLFPVVNVMQSTLRMAMNAVQEHQFSFRDAMILETTVQAGVTCLYSEDMQHKRSWKGMAIENPFTRIL
jgi:predicted nucleic acid-binding protein